MEPPKNQPNKVCFVTVGATASFTSLVQSILEQKSIDALREAGYTHLLVQYGKDGYPVFHRFLLRHPVDSPNRRGLCVDAFDFRQGGLSREMRMTQANKSDDRIQGMIISHAGSGSILEALRLGVPLVVVPNPSLQDNHQEELAKELQKQGYVVASHHEEISNAVGKAEALRSRMRTWPPVCGPKQRRRHQTLDEVMADELGFLD